MLGEKIDSSNFGYEMYDSLSVTNVVRRNGKESWTWFSSVDYRICCVTNGFGYFSNHNIEVGDIIIIPPACNILPVGDGLEYVCVSAKGNEMKLFADKLGFSKSSKIYSSLTDILPLWQSLCDSSFSINMLRAKGLIYYTISEICKISSSPSAAKSVLSASEQIKMFLDNNFTDSELSLKKISESLSYHTNYISKILKNRYGVSISKYINILRIRYACSLMEEGEISLKQLSSLCGFTDEEYFSLVFKQQIGETPREHLKRLRNPGTAL